MTIDEDWLREDRIKRMRSLVRSGVKHLIFLHEAVPFYLRQGQASEERVGELTGGRQGQSFRARLSPESLRDHEIAVGMFIDNRQNRAFDKIYKWVSDVNDAALRTFTDERFRNYQVLGDPPQLTANRSEPVQLRGG